MEERLRRLTRRLATGLVLLALAGGWAANARADIAYAFATQTISGITITPLNGPSVTNLATSTQDGVTTNGSGFSQSDPTNVPQAYQPPAGGNPAGGPGPDFYARYATGSPPVSPQAGGDFTRGDGRIQNLALASNVSSVVAESYLNTATSPGISAETGTAGLSASFNFVQGTASTLTISYNFSNDLFVFTTASGAASANYHFTITIKNAAGADVFTSATANTNLSLSAPPQGAEVIRSGSETVTTGTLAPGAYSFIFSGTAQSSVTAAAVPEPNVVMLVGIGGGLSLAVGALRRRSLRSAAK